MRSILKVMLGILILWSGVGGHAREEFFTEDRSGGKPAGLAGGQSHSGSLSKVNTLGMKPSGRKIDPLKDRLQLDLDPKEAIRRSLNGTGSQDLLAHILPPIPRFAVERAAGGTTIRNHSDRLA